MGSDSKVTFRVTVDDFRLLLEVILAPFTPDDLTNLVLRACTRPHGGIISVALPRDDAADLANLVHDAQRADPRFAGLAALLRQQLIKNVAAPSK